MSVARWRFGTASDSAVATRLANEVRSKLCLQFHRGDVAGVSRGPNVRLSALNALFVGMGARAAAAPELASSSVFGRVRRGSDHEFGSLIQLRPRRHGFLPKRPALARSLLSERVAIDPEAAASVPRSVQGGFGRLFPGPNLHHPFRRRAVKRSFRSSFGRAGVIPEQRACRSGGECCHGQNCRTEAILINLRGIDIVIDGIERGPSAHRLGILGPRVTP